jgi:hypothetical protein
MAMLGKAMTWLIMAWEFCIFFFFFEKAKEVT